MPVRLIIFNKPFRVLTRYTSPDGRAFLADFLDLPGVRPAGRLDFDSEGLLLLTDDGVLQARITDPAHRLAKTYWAEIEGTVTAEALERLRRGVRLADGPTRPAAARALAPPAGLWPRVPPIRHRERIPTAWLELTLTEGRNRQVRRMTAAVGLPTLRLVRAGIGPFTLAGLGPGEWRELPLAVAVEFARTLALSRDGRGVRSASPPRAPVRNLAAGRPASGRRARDRRR